MNHLPTTKHYVVPSIEIFDIAAEKGFSTSPQDPGIYDDWGSGGGAGGIGPGDEYDL